MEFTIKLQTIKSGWCSVYFEGSKVILSQGSGNTMPDLSDMVPFHSGQVENFCLLVLGQV